MVQIPLTLWHLPLVPKSWNMFRAGPLYSFDEPSQWRTSYYAFVTFASSMSQLTYCTCESVFKKMQSWYAPFRNSLCYLQPLNLFQPPAQWWRESESQQWLQLLVGAERCISHCCNLDSVVTKAVFHLSQHRPWHFWCHCKENKWKWRQLQKHQQLFSDLCQARNGGCKGRAQSDGGWEWSGDEMSPMQIMLLLACSNKDHSRCCDSGCLSLAMQLQWRATIVGSQSCKNKCNNRQE